MNTLNRREFVALPFVAAFAGCTTAQKENWLSTCEKVARSAADLGTTAWLARNPGDRNAFVLAHGALGILLKVEDYDSQKFYAALLSTLPADCRELEGEYGALMIVAGVQVLDGLGSLLFDIESNTATQRIMRAVYEGFDAALFPPAPVAARAGTKAVPPAPVHVRRYVRGIQPLRHERL